MARKEGYPKNELLRNVVSISGSSISSAEAEAAKAECYLNDPDIRLRFLRCECFVVTKAIQRFVSFLKHTSELFGDFVAERPIRLSDFTKGTELSALLNSRNQYLPFRDRSGRRVLVGVGTCDFDIDLVLRFKIIMFLHWVASEDIETQRKGVVIIAWVSNEGDKDTMWEDAVRPQVSYRARMFMQQTDAAMPLRVTSIHCYFKDTSFFRSLSTLYVVGLDSHNRSIFKAHFGEPMELRYTLSSYGIQEQLLPISHTGTVKTANHSRWVNALRANNKRKEKQQQQNQEEEEEILDCPGSYDVIFRKGQTYKNNPGNMYFRELIELTHDQHLKGSNKEKFQITWFIVTKIEDRNGRFLDWSTSRNMWVVNKDREKVRIKVAACYKQYAKTVLAVQERTQRWQNTQYNRSIINDTNNAQVKEQQQQLPPLSMIISNAIIVAEGTSRYGFNRTIASMPMSTPMPELSLMTMTTTTASTIHEQQAQAHVQAVQVPSGAPQRTSNFNSNDREDRSLQDNFFSYELFHSKRRKMTSLSFCDSSSCYSDEDSTSDDSSCFGRPFFQTL